MNSIKDFSDVVTQLGKDRAEKEEAFLKNLITETTEVIKTIGKQDDAWLVAQLMEHRGSSDPRVIEEYTRFREAVKAEVLLRLHMR